MKQQRIQIQAGHARFNELRETIERRKQLIQDTGYEHRDQDPLRHQLNMARAHLAELQEQKDHLNAPTEVNVEEAQQSVRKTNHRSKKSKHSTKESKHSKRSSRK